MVTKKEKESLVSRRVISISCCHRWKEIESYIGFSFFRKKKIKIFECEYCGEQFQQAFALAQNKGEVKR